MGQSWDSDHRCLPGQTRELLSEALSEGDWLTLGFEGIEDSSVTGADVSGLPRVEVESESTLGGDSSGALVGLAQETSLFEIGHDRAD